MPENNNEKNHANNSHSPTVGERLRLAREAKKITIEEVEKELRLTKDNVVYLESDQWDKLHGRPYARGYFSSYVNFLGLPHAEMLALFNLEYTSEEPSIDGFKRADNNDNGGAIAGWFKSLFLIIVLVAATWFAYQYWLELQAQTQEVDDVEINTSLSGFDDNQGLNDSFGSSVVEPLPVAENQQISFTEVEETIETQALQTEVVEVEVQVQVVNETTTFITDEPLDNLVLSEQVETESIEQQNTSITDSDTGLADEQQQAIVETKLLVLQFEENCWLEVSDRNNKKLLHKMARANETVELTGNWPLHVLIGNASAVKVTYNNTEFDLSSHIRANVARFSVGEDAE